MPGCGCETDATRLERRTLGQLLLINAVFFCGEALVGWLAESTGLLADSLDMLADAGVYGLAIYATGRAADLKRKAARMSGVLQIALGIGVFAEAVRRLIYGSEPVSYLMMVMGGLALGANMTCLFLLAKHRHGEVHMRASWIFSTNDVLANLGVILSGAAVLLFGNRLPDLLIGACIAMLVVHGGYRILRQTQCAATE